MNDEPRAPDSEGVPPSISELIRSYQARTGESLHRVSERSARSGHQVTQRYLWDLANGKAKGWPKSGDTFIAIAEGLETTPLAVVLGFAVYHNVPVRMPAFASRIPPAMDHVTESVREAVLGLTWALTSDAPVRRYLPDGDVPDLTEAEGLIEDRGTPARGNDVGGQS